MKRVYFGGTRHLPLTTGNVESLESIVMHCVNNGAVIHTGCQFGADQGVVMVTPPLSLVVFAVESQQAAPAHVTHAESLGATVRYEAGGTQAPIKARYLLRSRAAFQGCDTAVFFTPGAGSLAVARDAIKAGLPVYVFSATQPANPPKTRGEWQASSFARRPAWLWVSEKQNTIEMEITKAVMQLDPTPGNTTTPPAATRETATPQQPRLFTTPETDKRQARKEARRVAELQAKMRQLHDELNKEYQREKVTISSPSDAAGLVSGYLAAQEQEELHVISLDRRNNVLEITALYKGSVSSSQVRIGEIFRRAIALNASAVIMAHNHPSGDPTPSPDDIALTRGIVQAGKMLDIDLLDHLVIGAGGRFVSLKERGLGFS